MDHLSHPKNSFVRAGVLRGAGVVWGGGQGSCGSRSHVGGGALQAVGRDRKGLGRGPAGWGQGSCPGGHRVGKGQGRGSGGAGVMQDRAGVRTPPHDHF